MQLELLGVILTQGDHFSCSHNSLNMAEIDSVSWGLLKLVQKVVQLADGRLTSGRDGKAGKIGRRRIICYYIKMNVAVNVCRPEEGYMSVKLT